VHGKIGEHKVKKNTVMVDSVRRERRRRAGPRARLRGCRSPPSTSRSSTRSPPTRPDKSLAGKDVSLHIAIKEARERKQPALDDELAKDTGEADTLDELKHKIRDRLLEQDRQRIKQELTRRSAKEVVKRNPFAIAPALVERHAESHGEPGQGAADDGGHRPRGERRSSTRRRCATSSRPRPRRRRAPSILIQAIAEREGIQVSDADVQKRVAELATARQENSKKLRAELERTGRIHGVRAQLLEEKTLDMLLTQAKIADEDPDRLIVTPEEAVRG
jgi:trigger factor